MPNVDPCLTAATGVVSSTASRIATLVPLYRVTMSGVGLITLIQTPWLLPGHTTALATTTLAFRGTLSTTQVPLTSCFTSPLISISDMGGTCTVFTIDTVTGSELSSGALRSPVTSGSLSRLPPTDKTRDAMSIVHRWSSRKSRPSITSADN